MTESALHRFLSRLGDVRAAALRAAGEQTIESRLHEAHARAAQKWPGVELAAVIFADALARALRAPTPTVEDLDAVHAEELFLTTACSLGDRRALHHLEHLFASILPAVGRVVRDRSTADEVVQRLRAKLLVGASQAPPTIARYHGRGSLVGWLRVAGLREALDLRREEREYPDDALVLLSTEHPVIGEQERAADPEFALLRARYGPELRRIVSEVIASLPADDRAILRLHYVDALDMHVIGRMFGVHRSTISRRLTQIREAVSHDTRKLVRERMGASTSEIDSILRLADSVVDLTFSAIVR